MAGARQQRQAAARATAHRAAGADSDTVLGHDLGHNFDGRLKASIWVSCGHGKVQVIRGDGFPANAPVYVYMQFKLTANDVLESQKPCLPPKHPPGLLLLQTLMKLLTARITSQVR